MKKLAALLLAVVMVVALVPAMALVSSAAPTTIELGKYGTGIETWKNGSLGEVITQFLVTFEQGEGTPTVKDIMGALDYTSAKKDTETGDIIAPTANGGYFKLTITDSKSKSTVVDKFVPKTVYDAGDWIIWRFDTCEHGFVPVEGETYSMKVEIVIGSTVKYQGTAEDLYWEAGNYPCDKIYKDGVPADGSDPEDSKPKQETNYPVKGIEFTRYHGTNDETGIMDSDWENWPKDSEYYCLIIELPASKLVAKTDADAGALKGTIDLGNGTTLNCELDSNYDFGENMLLRLRTDKVPNPGKAYNATITLKGTDGTLKYQGTCLISNGETTEDNVDTGSGKPTVKTGDTVIYATVAMAVALVGMAVVVKKVRG